MPAAHVCLRVWGDSKPFFTLERSIRKPEGVRKLHLCYLKDRPIIPMEYQAKYEITNSYSWLLRKGEPFIERYLQKFRERKLRSKRLRGVF